jgi:hypothetical protein
MGVGWLGDVASSPAEAGHQACAEPQFTERLIVRLDLRRWETIGANCPSIAASLTRRDARLKIFARNRANVAVISNTVDTSHVSGTVGWARTTDLRIHNPAL